MREKNEKKIVSDVRGNKWNEKNFQKISNSKIKILIREHDLCIDYISSRDYHLGAVQTKKVKGWKIKIMCN